MRKETKSKTLRIMLHILIWTVIMVLPVYSAKRFQTGSNFLVFYYSITAISAVIFYINYLFLVPVLFFHKKRYRYLIALIILLFLFYFISDFANEKISAYISKQDNSEQFITQPGEEGRPKLPPLQTRRPRFIIAVPNAHFIGYITSSLFMVFLSLGLRVLERQSKIEKIQEDMERAKLNAELAFLKNQISPHFFFNTLNNIYSLSTSSPEDAQRAILKLSKMMRYLLYDSEDGDTKLSNEIELITSYIDLMKLRLEEKYNLRVTLPGEYEDYRMPPLLFIPFIENAFKHGVSFREDSFIEISLAVADKRIVFRTLNRITVSPDKTGLESSGIGLNNVRKRLDLLFPAKHTLELNKTESTFEVLLKIDLTA